MSSVCLIVVSFPHASLAERIRLASTLAETLRGIDPSVQVHVLRGYGTSSRAFLDRADTEDLEATLVVVLGTVPATEIAKAIGAWLARNSGAQIEIRRNDEVIASHLDSEDVPRIAAAVSDGITAGEIIVPSADSISLVGKRASEEDQRKRQQAAEQARLEEECKQAAEQGRLEEQRQQAAERVQLENERKRAEEETRLEEERKRAVEKARLEEELKQAAEQPRREEEVREREERRHQYAYGSGIAQANGGSKATVSFSSPSTSVRMFYATDRKESRTENGEIYYSAERSLEGLLNYGECRVSIPKIHKIGKLESPSILKLEFRADPERHIILESIQTLAEKVFLNNVAVSVSKAPAKDAFVFIHGYNVSFEDAARRTGQIAFDLHFVGAPILYSWPSNGRFADYIKDETNITWATPHFERFLNLLAKYSGATRMHIIAHSMGNRAVCDAVKHLSERPEGQLRFNHLVLAAPDIDADTFCELAEALRKLSGRITLYESSNDKAIKASRKIHGSPRAGEPLLLIPGLDTIDASAVSTDFLSHSYFSDNWPLLSDIYSILAFDKAPDARFGLAEIVEARGKYYAFRPA
jgi:esterase/lipase superfamily enzyme